MYMSYLPTLGWFEGSMGRHIWQFGIALGCLKLKVLPTYLKPSQAKPLKWRLPLWSFVLDQVCDMALW